MIDVYILAGAVLCSTIKWLALARFISKVTQDDAENRFDKNPPKFPAIIFSFAIILTFDIVLWICGHGIYVVTHPLKNIATTEDVGGSHIDIDIILIIAAMLSLGIWVVVFYHVHNWWSRKQKNQRLLLNILDNIPLALFVKDAALDFRYIFLNKLANDLFCLDQLEMIDRCDHEVFVEAATFRQIDNMVMAGGKVVEIEAESVTTPKGSFTSHTLKVPIYDDKGQPHLLLGVAEDVTERTKAKQELLLAKDKAEDADRAKSEFLANMSHELRTPLNSILGTARLLQDTHITPDQRDMVETVFASSMSLLETVNDILDLSKIEAGGLQLENIGFDLDYVLQSIIDCVKPLAQEKHLELYRTNGRAPPYVKGDPTRLGRILTNLISNAIKYTENGSIKITTSHETIGDDSIMYRCMVTDTGIGIAPEKHATIFEKFTQADTSTTRRYGGTGLGLAITKQLVELMGGTIGLYSNQDRGTTFWFEITFTTTNKLHRKTGSTRQLQQYSRINPAKARVLIAEDHPMNQILIRRVIERFGIEHCTLVPNGLEALNVYKKAEWDLILMDCHMPEMNGYDTSEMIREHEKKTERHTPIIAMTANAMVGDREKCLQCGMDDYLSKPIMIEELQRLMWQWIDLPLSDKVETEPDTFCACVDPEQIRGFTEGDRELEHQLIEAFITQSDINLQLLAANRIDGPAASWVEAAHMLKGGAAGMGAEKLRGLCAVAQNMAATSSSERQQILEQIEKAYHDVKEALHAEFLIN